MAKDDKKKAQAGKKKTADERRAFEKLEPSRPKSKEHRGMAGPIKKKQIEAIDGLHALLHELNGTTADDAPTRIKIYGTYDRVTGSNGKAFDNWNVYEIDFWTGTGDPARGHGHGAAMQSCVPESLGLFKACEGYLEEFHTKPKRPKGWESNLDLKAEAADMVRAVWGLEEPEEPAKINVEQVDASGLFNADGSQKEVTPADEDEAKPAAVSEDRQHYEYVRVIVDEDGDARFEYKLKGSTNAGSQGHDENVGEWSDADIKKLVRGMLDITADDPVEIEIDNTYIPEDED